MTRHEAVQLLTQRRRDLRITQAVLAATVGTWPGRVTRWENGREAIPDGALHRYAGLVGMTLRVTPDGIEVDDV